ncbi:hypothetical protein D6C93_02593 [Aureobasidium pullulans]|nr:hypothetical protein D6C93_02593 [Aureobasidium pullulans]
MNSRQSKTLLKDSIKQKDVETQQLRSEVRQKDAEIGQAREEILRYKRAISKSSKVNNQTSDTSIQADVDALFCSIRDWALDVVRKEQLELDPEPEYASWLLTMIPHLMDRPSGLQVNALVVGLSAVLVELLDEDHIFGYASSGNVAKATELHLSMRDIKSTWQQKKQWEFLTHEILKQDDASAKQAAESLLDRFLAESGEMVFKTCSKSMSSEATARLRKNMRPRPEALRALDFQEAEYWLQPISFPCKGETYLLDRTIMEDVNGRTMGDVDEDDDLVLETIWFPALVKRDISEDGENAEWTVVSKARVQAAV